jgi:hypothetical protein
VDGTAEAGHTGPAAGVWLRLPKVDLVESFVIEREYFWDPAPLSRKLLVLGGLMMIWAWPRLPSHLARWKSGLVTDTSQRVYVSQ